MDGKWRRPMSKNVADDDDDDELVMEYQNHILKCIKLEPSTCSYQGGILYKIWEKL